MVTLALDWLPRLLWSALLTFGLAAVIFTLSGVLGLSLAVITVPGRSRRLRQGAELLSAVFRALPELLLLFLVFFGGPQIGIDMGPVGSTVLAFTLVGTAYDYQVFKGALSAIPQGQYEAGQALGLSPRQVFRLVILPQLLPLARHSWITFAIGTVKRLSIASAISVSEIMYVTKQAIAATNAPFLFLFLAVGLYILIITPLLIIQERGGHISLS